MIAVQCSECQCGEKQARVNGKTVSVSVWCLWCLSLWLWLWLWLWHVQNASRLYIQNVPVCTGTTRTCVSTCARFAGTHGSVLNLHTGTPTQRHTETDRERKKTEKEERREREEREKETAFSRAPEWHVHVGVTLFFFCSFYHEKHTYFP